MEAGQIIILWFFNVVVFCAILYFVIKIAVKDAIKELRGDTSGNNDEDSDEEIGERIAKVVCPECGGKYDMDYPKCPYCQRINDN